MGKELPTEHAADRRYWAGLSDQDLLSTEFATDDPTSLAGVVETLPAVSETPIVEFAYDTRGSGRRVRCIHCKFENHNRGFVLKFEAGTRILVGKDCGEKLYGAHFEAIAKDFDTARDRAYYLRRQKVIAASLPDFITGIHNVRQSVAVKQFAELKQDFNRTCQELVTPLAHICGPGAGLLYKLERVRDREAEARRDEQDEIALERASAMTKTAREKARKEGKIPRPNEKKRPIFRSVNVQIGTVAGRGFFKLEMGPDAKFAAFHRRAHVLHSQFDMLGLPNRQLKLFADQLVRLEEEIERELDRLATPIDAFEAGNLAKLAEWGNARAERDRYRAGIGTLTDLERGLTVTCPPNYRPPGRAFLKAFQAATDPGSSQR